MNGAPPPDVSFGRLALRAVVVHTVSYTLVGLVASNLLDYRSYWQSEYMAAYRPFDSRWVAAGPALQPIRGLIFAAVLYPFRSTLLADGGFGKLFALLVGLGVASTFAAGPGSVEGVIYTRLPPLFHLFGLPEVITQAALFSAVLIAWTRHPHRAWSIVLGLLTALAIASSVAGVLLGAAP